MPSRRIRRGDGRFSVNMTVERPDGTKRRVYFYGRPQAEAKRKADAARDRLEQGAPIRDATRSVSDWLAEWRATFLQASDRAPSTKNLYVGLTLRHVEPVIGRTPLGQVRPSDVTRVLLSMERGGSAASTRRNTYAAMRSGSMTPSPTACSPSTRCCASADPRPRPRRRSPSRLTRSRRSSRAPRDFGTPACSG